MGWPGARRSHRQCSSGYSDGAQADADRRRKAAQADHGACWPPWAAHRGRPKIVADHLVEANLKGHPEPRRRHDAGTMCSRLARRAISSPTQHVQTACSRTVPWRVFDGQMGFGQVVAREAMDWAIETARADGSAIYTLRDAQHIGRVGTYAEQGRRRRADLAALRQRRRPARRASPRSAAATGASPPTRSAIGIPRPTDAALPVILDFATSQVALGKVRVAYKAGKPMDARHPDRCQGPADATSPAVIYEAPIGAVSCRWAATRAAAWLWSAACSAAPCPAAAPSSPARPARPRHRQRHVLYHHRPRRGWADAGRLS